MTEGFLLYKYFVEYAILSSNQNVSAHIILIYVLLRQTLFIGKKCHLLIINNYETTSTYNFSSQL